MFHTAPVLIATSTVMIFAALPFSEGFVIANMPMSLLFILAAFSIAPLGILIAGWASNNKYSLIGGMRAAAQLMAYGIPLPLDVLALLMHVGSLNLAEMERIPFDIPEAEAELVEGWLTEYSGMRFGLVFGFKWLRALAGSALVVILYLGGWSGPVFVTLTPSVGPTVIPIPIIPHEVWF